MAESWNKKEREKKKQQAAQAKRDRRLERKEQGANGNNLSEMLAYVDENGFLTTAPPDKSQRVEINAEDIVLGVPKMDDLEPRREEGIVTYYNEEKGYGFIRDNRTKQSVFFHKKQLTGNVNLQTKVTFVTSKGLKGPEAQDVQVVS